jgi:hypothetical protein
MWELAPMSVFINHTLCRLLIFQMWDWSVTISPLKPLMSSLGPCHAVLQYHMVLQLNSDTICNYLGKALDTPVLSPQME